MRAKTRRRRGGGRRRKKVSQSGGDGGDGGEGGGRGDRPLEELEELDGSVGRGLELGGHVFAELSHESHGGWGAVEHDPLDLRTDALEVLQGNVDVPREEDLVQLLRRLVQLEKVGRDLELPVQLLAGAVELQLEGLERAHEVLLDRRRGLDPVEKVRSRRRSRREGQAPHEHHRDARRRRRRSPASHRPLCRRRRRRRRRRPLR